MQLKNLKLKIQNQPWSDEYLEAYPFFMYSSAEAIGNLHSHFAAYFTFIVVFFQRGMMHWHYRETEQERIARYLLRRIIRDPGLSSRLLKNWLQSARRFYRQYQKNKQADLSVLDNAQLAKVFLNFYTDYMRRVKPAFILEGFTFKGDALVAERLREVLQKAGWEARFNEYFPILTSTTRPSFVEEAERALWRLAAKIKRQPAQKKRLLIAYAKKFSWLYNNYAGTGKFTLQEARENYRQLKRGHKERRELVKRQRARLLRELQAPPAFRRLVLAVDDFAWWQDQRKKMVFHCIELQKLFLTELSRRFKLNYAWLRYLTPSEYVKVLQTEVVPLAVLRKRDQGSYFIIKNRAPIQLYTAQYQTVKSWVRSKYSAVRKTSQLTGAVANRGLGRGVAKIILSVKAGARFKAGDVLIAPMTRPDFMPFIKKAAAIVTDDGGLTCHAAIVARELNIPCIVGAKVATKVLKDGDRVEVDANRGIVRKM